MKNTKIIGYNKFYSYIYNMNNSPISKDVLIHIINKFFDEIIMINSEVKSVHIQLRFMFNKDRVRSVSNVFLVKVGDRKDVIKQFLECLEVKNDYYVLDSIDNVVIYYKLNAKDLDIVKKQTIPIESKNIYNNTSIINGYKLPNTMDLWLWGECVFNDKHTIATIKRFNSKIIYKVFLYDTSYHVQVISETNKILFEFTDECNTYIGRDLDLNTFVRSYNNNKYNYNDGKLTAKIINKKADKIKPLKYNIITMDLETRSLPLDKEGSSSKMEVVCVSIYDGNTTKSFYIDDYKNPRDLLTNSIKSILTRKYSGYKVYLHNFSNFDSIFMLSVLTDLTDKIEPIIRDGRYINIKLNYGPKNKYVISFRDSLLLLPFSLKDLYDSFDEKINVVFCTAYFW